ncbi:MAG: hypothetical protein F6K42_28840 [Leptolyngbya sp. SIO1D8]|nr:hypothetical protein [Leptolyngbya sp. SIO1D8]
MAFTLKGLYHPPFRLQGKVPVSIDFQETGKTTQRTNEVWVRQERLGLILAESKQA